MLNDFCKRLTDAAERLDWETSKAPDFAQKRFRGREDDAEVPLPDAVMGLRLGSYPVLVTKLNLTYPMGAQIRALHNQMLLARSYMSNSEVINAHAFLLCEDVIDDMAVSVIDTIERDEQVCRKLVWCRGVLPAVSFENFAERTFLARPWFLATAVDDAPLDQNSNLVIQVLQDEGLSLEAAQRWVELAQAEVQDPQELIGQLVKAMDL